MKKIIFLLSTFIIVACSSSKSNDTQKPKITSENYYEYFVNALPGNKLTTAWVNKYEVAQILEEEMKNAGFEWISTFRLIKISDEEYVNAICFSEKSKVGFLYEGSHAMPDEKRRSLKSMYKENTGNDYAEKVVSLDSEAKFIKIKDVPSNFFILKEDPYWYQYTEKPQNEKTLVDKQTILKILRSDIKIVIASFKK
ncbi:hypothetical protein [Flavobacterium tibetense]|jgi:hypothetical protein|uniref:Uncharacterized protein n=1 Tax=Flavobacterium tibetense TaxID=2233533 RepID=A0A365P024_9FLAO|nr:hypothetical protein [Flavobacterium tibetense]RBA27848.1 hypothetical protein DPN68_10195 [Flavobacterium tibetense]